MGKHFSAAIGLEMPSTDFTVSNEQRMTNQFIPDIPSYIQYAWGANNSSHVRLSSLIRNGNYRNPHLADHSALLAASVLCRLPVYGCGIFSADHGSAAFTALRRIPGYESGVRICGTVRLSDPKGNTDQVGGSRLRAGLRSGDPLSNPRQKERDAQMSISFSLSC